MTHNQHYEATTNTVRDSLKTIFAELDLWFDRDAERRARIPQQGRWSIDLVLEHVGLTNHFLLLTLNKWTRTAVKRAERGDPMPVGESDLSRLDPIGIRGSFGWERPEHMEPQGEIEMTEVRAQLKRQLDECLDILDQLKGGLGALCEVTMTVNDLGKIDLYQWLYFIAQHATRHVQQLESMEREFLAS